MGALGDCELIRSGLLAQPVNTLTTLPLVALGIWLASKRRSRWVGIALMATGAGSFVFHGPMPAWSEWAHDVTLAWLIAVIGGINTRWERWSHLPALGGLAAVFAIVPITADPVAVSLAVIVGGSILLRQPSTGEMVPLGILAAVAVLGRLGATGGPLCEPTSIWQLHGLWHLGAAITVTWWTVVSWRRDPGALSQP